MGLATKWFKDKIVWKLSWIRVIKKKSVAHTNGFNDKIVFGFKKNKNLCHLKYI